MRKSDENVLIILVFNQLFEGTITTFHDNRTSIVEQSLKNKEEYVSWSSVIPKTSMIFSCFKLC